jgi:integrase
MEDCPWALLDLPAIMLSDPSMESRPLLLLQDDPIASNHQSADTGRRGLRILRVAVTLEGFMACLKRTQTCSYIGKLHPHMLRHTYGTRLYNVEQDLRFVQDQLGHASPTTTAIYAKTNVKARRRQLEALEPK